MTAQYFISREGRAVVPGSGGRHRKPVEPSLAALVARQVAAQLGGLFR
ncbi:MAG: hypothetical protein ACREX8_07655 [Gammaproteobacteria bacterium]